MMQLVLIILTKRKEMIRYCESFGYGGQGSQQTFLPVLTEVSVPVESG
jgi:hypothetical protein